MLDRAMSPLKVKSYFHGAAWLRDLADDLGGDLSLLRALRRALLPIPALDREPALDPKVFPPRRPLRLESLRGKRVGIVATGGGGAMVCALGVVRACEEAGVTIGAISACSGSAMALAPVAAGLSATEAAAFILGLRRGDYVDPDWSELLKLPLRMGRGFTGIIKAEAIERLYDGRLGGVRVGELPIPFYSNVWDLDRNRLLHLGTRTMPELTLGRLVRAAVTLPLFMRPIEIDGALCGDGGVVSVFPVDPLVDHHPELDLYLGINAFYPEDFTGEDRTGWDRQTWSVLRMSQQTRQCQHLESARMQLRRIAGRSVMCHPLPYDEIKGSKLYEQFLDRSSWPSFIRRGHEEGRRALRELAKVARTGPAAKSHRQEPAARREGSGRPPVGAKGQARGRRPRRSNILPTD